MIVASPNTSGPSPLPSGTVTFLFTDIEGSTRLLEQLRGDFASVLADQRDLLRASFADWEGVEVDTQGDAFFVAFPRAADAVACAADAQQRLAAHRWPRDAHVRVRMGLHTGEPIIARTGYVGMDVHRAARIAAAGHGGQILISSVTRDLLDDELPDGATLVDLGDHRLKDVRGPMHLYQVTVPGSTGDYPPLRTMATGDEPPTPGEAPFMGLQAFGEVDASRFFGREELTARLVSRVGAERFLAIVGASGSGKSSIVRAGLVPALRTAPGSWQTVVITPTERPLEALALALTAGAPSVVETARLMDDLQRDPRSLHLTAVRTVGTAGRLLLVIDQFEELYTLCRDPRERQAFIACLMSATIAGGPTHVVISLRADFYGHLASDDELREAVATRQQYIGPMSPAELRRAIEAPASNGGWEFVPGLVDLILRDVGHEPGALPLLSHALLETWQRRRGTVMTLKAYGESGGVQGAIARTADRVFDIELSSAQRTLARDIFLRLTELGEGTQDMRRRVDLREIVPAEAEDGDPVRGVLRVLADRRLITIAETTVEVAHEALIREWPTLREWLSEDREGLRTHRRLTQAAEEWRLLERDDSALYRGLRLAEADAWAQAGPAALNVQEQGFLDASRALALREEAAREDQRRRELEAAEELAAAQHQRADDAAHAARGLRRRAFFLGGALMVAGVLAIAAVFFGLAAETAKSQALSRQLAAQSLASRDDLSLSVLLALEALQHFDSTQARVDFLDVLDTQPEIVRRIHHDRSHFFHGLAGGARAIAVTADGGMAAVSTDEGIQLWDLATGTLVGDPVAGSYPAFSPVGQRLGSFDAETKTVEVRDLATSSTRVVASQSGVDALESLLWDDTGTSVKWVTYSDAATIIASWDPVTGRRSDLALPATHVVLSPDGAHFFFQYRFPLQLSDTPTGSTFGPAFRGDIAFSLDGKYLAEWTSLPSDVGPAAVQVYRLADFQKIGPEFPGFKVHTFAVTPDERRALFLGDFPGYLSLWDLMAGTRVYSNLAPTSTQTLAVGGSRREGLIVAANADGTLEVIDLERTQRLALDRLPPAPVRRDLAVTYALSLDGTLLASVNSTGVTLRDVSSGQVRATLSIPLPALWSIAIGPDNNGIFLGEGSDITSCTLVYRAINPAGAPAGAMPDGTPCSSGLAMSPDGSQVAIPGTPTVLVDRAASRLRTLAVNGDHAAFLPGSAFVVVQSGNPLSDDLGGPQVLGAVRLVDVATGLVSADIPFDGLATAVDASPDGSLVVVAVSDGGGEAERASLLVVDVAMKGVIGRIEAGPGRISAIRFEGTTGRRTALAVTSDGRVQRWDLDPDSWLTTACQLAGRNLSQAEWTRYLGTEPYHETCPGAPIPASP